MYVSNGLTTPRMAVRRIDLRSDRRPQLLLVGAAASFILTKSKNTILTLLPIIWSLSSRGSGKVLESQPAFSTPLSLVSETTFLSYLLTVCLTELISSQGIQNTWILSGSGTKGCICTLDRKQQREILHSKAFFSLPSSKTNAMLQGVRTCFFAKKNQQPADEYHAIIY